MLTLTYTQMHVTSHSHSCTPTSGLPVIMEFSMPAVLLAAAVIFQDTARNTAGMVPSAPPPPPPPPHTHTLNPATSVIGGSCHKYHFCRHKSFVRVLCLSRLKTRLLSRQKYSCRDKTFVATNTILSRQTRVCCDKNDTCGSS